MLVFGLVMNKIVCVKIYDQKERITIYKKDDDEEEHRHKVGWGKSRRRKNLKRWLSSRCHSQCEQFILCVCVCVNVCEERQKQSSLIRKSAGASKIQNT